MTNEELKRSPTVIEVGELLLGVRGVKTMENIIRRLEFNRDQLKKELEMWRNPNGLVCSKCQNLLAL